MNRIKQAFEKAKQENRAALIGFMVAGDPNLEESLRIIDAACDAGLDVLELGIPFSDPVADGPVIQRACGRAIGAGMNINQALDMVATLRKKHHLPIIFFSYYNPILSMGNETFIQKAREVGADGLLVVDLPHEEPTELTQFIPNADEFSMIHLITPTTVAEQRINISNVATGFIYVVSRPGVTGSGDGIPKIDWDSLEKEVNALRTLTSTPLAIGFGITDSKDVAATSRFADGVIIGSAFERAIETAIDSNTTVSESVAQLVKKFRPFLRK